MFSNVGSKELLSKKIALEIESAIYSQKLKEGEQLPTEFELCEQFGVSRTSLREALRMLSAKGLISIEKGRGTFVKKITSESVTDPLQHYLRLKLGVPYILEIIEARKAIEPELAKLAAINRTNSDIEKMEKAIEELGKYEGGPEGLAILDMEFHQGIANATKNRLLPLMIEPIFRLMPIIKSKIISDVPSAIESAIVWHRKILDAIIEQNPHMAYEKMEHHLIISHEHAEEMFRIEGMVNKNEKE